MVRTAINKLISTYAIFVLLWFIHNRLFQDTWWGIVVLDKFAEYFLVASIPVFLLSLVSRHTFTVFLALLPVVITGYFYMPLLSPLSANAPGNVSGNISGDGSASVTSESSDRFRVMTYNIWNHNKDLQAVSDIIQSLDADVVALQEITEDQRSMVVSELSPIYPYFHISKPILGGTTALFSRHPLHNITELDFDIDRPAVIADMDWAGTRVTVVSAHLNPSFWAYYQQPWQRIPGNYHQYIKDQNQQADMIIDALKLRNESKAKFLACDCNSQETASTNKLLRSYFKDAFRTHGLQLGSPKNTELKFERKLNHIDYVWFKGVLEPVAIYRSKTSAGSDHEPVVADFRFPE